MTLVITRRDLAPAHHPMLSTGERRLGLLEIALSCLADGRRTYKAGPLAWAERCRDLAAEASANATELGAVAWETDEQRAAAATLAALFADLAKAARRLRRKRRT